MKKNIAIVLFIGLTLTVISCSSNNDKANKMNDSIPIVDVLNKVYEFSSLNNFIVFDRSNNSLMLDEVKTVENINKFKTSGLFSTQFIIQMNKFADAVKDEIKNDTNISQNNNKYAYNQLHLFTGLGSHPDNLMNNATISKIDIKKDSAYVVWYFKNEDNQHVEKPSYAYLIKTEKNWQIEKLQVLEEHPLITNE